MGRGDTRPVETWRQEAFMPILSRPYSHLSLAHTQATTRSPKRTAAARMHTLPMLPPPMFRQIVALTLDNFSDALMPKPMTRIPYETLRNLALVAKDWTAPVREDPREREA